MILELVRDRPDWWAALTVAMTRPEGVPERRADEDPWKPIPVDRPRRISDDLAWFRYAMEHPAEHGMRELDEALPAAWEVPAADDVHEKLRRLEQRGVLAAAGYALHEPDL